MKRALAWLTALVLLLSVPARSQTQLLNLDAADAQLADVIALLAAESETNIVADESVKAERITVHLHGITFRDALEVLTQTYDLSVRRIGGILIVGAGAAMNRRFEDRNDPASPQTAVLTLSHADAEAVSKEIAPALPDGTVIVPDKRTQSIVITGGADTLARARRLVTAFDAPAYGRSEAGVARVYRLRYVKPSDVATDLKGVLPEGSFVVDEAQNALIVTGSADVQQTASAFVRSIDAPGPQVLFEVRVADLEPENDQSNVGIQFGGYDLTGQPVAGAATYAFAGNSIAINARLNAMISEGHAQILATPKLVTLNNKEADLLIGQTYPVIYYDTRVGGQQVQFVDVGVKLRLTPTIGRDGSVTAEMHPEYSAIQGFVGGYPVIANRKADSTLRVADNQTIVLGGLLRENDSETLTKVPGLADIPVIGKIFQNRERTHQRDEVVFLITPHVIYPETLPPSR